jgi:hypothetical protein
VIISFSSGGLMGFLFRTHYDVYTVAAGNEHLFPKIIIAQRTKAAATAAAIKHFTRFYWAYMA